MFLWLDESLSLLWWKTRFFIVFTDVCLRLDGSLSLLCSKTRFFILGKDLCLSLFKNTFLYSVQRFESLMRWKVCFFVVLKTHVSLSCSKIRFFFVTTDIFLWQNKSPNIFRCSAQTYVSLAMYVSFTKEPYKRDDILQKRCIILRSLLIIATPYTKAKDDTGCVRLFYKRAL